MSSPQEPGTPRRGRSTPSGSQQGNDTPSKDVTTPMRWESSRRDENAVTSPPHSVAPTSPATGS